MRDKNRIKPFLEKFQEFWEKYPDLRFGQIADIIANRVNIDIFYIEDNLFLEQIEKLLKE